MRREWDGEGGRRIEPVTAVTLSLWTKTTPVGHQPPTARGDGSLKLLTAVLTGVSRQGRAAKGATGVTSRGRGRSGAVCTVQD